MALGERKRQLLDPKKWNESRKKTEKALSDTEERRKNPTKSK